MIKRLLRTAAVLCLAVLFCLPASGWGRVGHAAVAKIAENHLTKTTAKRVNEIMQGVPLVAIASYCDEYRQELNEVFPLEWTQGVPHAHTFEVDENNYPYPVLQHPKTGRGLTNAVYFADHCMQDICHYKDFPDSIQWKEVVMLTHLIGDMHCPGHVRYAAKHKDTGKAQVTVRTKFGDEHMSYHHVWDAFMVENRLPFGLAGIAEICDDCSPSQIEKICSGTIYDWGKDVADACQECRMSVGEGDVLDATWIRDHTALTKQQIRNAGYRLAHALNMAFDKSYARKHSK